MLVISRYVCLAIKYLHYNFLCIDFHTGFRPTNDRRLIRLMRKNIRTSQALFSLRIEFGIPRVHL